MLTTEQIMASHKANIETLFGLTQKAFEGVEKLVELNVEEQCINVIKMAVLQKHYLQKGFPTVHGWVFDMHSGHLTDLRIDFIRKLDGIREIYDLGLSAANET